MDQDGGRDRMVFIDGRNRRGRRVQDLTVSTRVWLGGQGRGSGRVRGVRLSDEAGLVEIAVRAGAERELERDVRVLAVRFEGDGKEETLALPWGEFVPLAWDDRADAAS